jgi:hypothetical protein
MVVKTEITANGVYKILKLGFLQNDSKMVWLIILSFSYIPEEMSSQCFKLLYQ